MCMTKAEAVRNTPLLPFSHENRSICRDRLGTLSGNSNKPHDKFVDDLGRRVRVVVLPAAFSWYLANDKMSWPGRSERAC